MRTLLLLMLPFWLFAEPFKVGSYNVENLFDAHYSGREYDDYTTKHGWTEKMVEIKLNHTAEVICDLEADILALQEIENEAILKRLRQRLKQVGCDYYPYYAITKKKKTPIQTALFSRFPIVKQQEVRVSYSPRIRNILEVEVKVDGKPFHIFVNHWKSRGYGGVESKRIGYAKALKTRINQLSGRDYLLLGDFNTDYDAHLKLDKKINDTEGKTGLHHTLGAAKGKVLTSEVDMLQSGRQHYTLWQELPYDQRWSSDFYGKKGTPDHIVLPTTLFDGENIDYQNDSFGVFRPDYLFTRQGYMNRWQIKGKQHLGKGYSDHLPIYAWFDCKPYRQPMQKKVERSEEVDTIASLYQVESLKQDLILKDAVVIRKHRNSAVIKQRPEGRGIYLYNCAGDLEAGRSYDLLVKAIKTYHGLKEITHLYVRKQKKKVDTEGYYLREGDLHRDIGQRQNEVFKSLVGLYRNRNFYVGDTKLPIYFKNKNSIPPNGAKIKIDYAHLGYYKVLQLVVYDPENITILEK